MFCVWFAYVGNKGKAPYSRKNDQKADSRSSLTKCSLDAKLN